MTTPNTLVQWDHSTIGRAGPLNDFYINPTVGRHYSTMPYETYGDLRLKCVTQQVSKRLDFVIYLIIYLFHLFNFIYFIIFFQETFTSDFILSYIIFRATTRISSDSVRGTVALAKNKVNDLDIEDRCSAILPDTQALRMLKNDRVRSHPSLFPDFFKKRPKTYHTLFRAVLVPD